MSYSDARWQKLIDKHGIFSGGYVDNVSQVDMWPQFSPYLRNARLDGQSIIIRPWHDLYSTLVTWDYPRSIWAYLRSDPTNNRLIVRHNTTATEKLVSIDSSGTVTPITTWVLVTSNNKTRFVNVADSLYCMNWVDYYGKLNGTTYSNPSTWVTNFAPSFGVVFNSSMWCAWWSTNSNKVYKSVADSYEDFAWAGSDTFTFQEQITWLSANSEALFYFTKNTISVTWFQDITDTAGTLSYVTRPLTVKEWAANHDCIIEVGTKVYYLSSSNTINMIARGANINGFEVMELSDREYAGITKLMWSLAKDQTNAFAVYYPNEMLIKRHLYSQGSTFADIVVVYDTIHDAFLIDEQKYFTDWVFFDWFNYTTSAIENKVYKDEYGQVDDDQPIPFEYWTKEHYLWDATGKKTIRESRSMVDINELAWLEQTIWMDGAQTDEKTIDIDNIPLLTWGIGTYSVGTSEVGTEWWRETWDDMFEVPILRTKWNLNKKCRKIQWRFANNTLAGKVRLKTIDVKVEMLPELSTNLTK